MLPLIPKDLLDELNRRFPNQSPQNGETHQDLFGVVASIRLLNF